jgi:hypothetical protein
MKNVFISFDYDHDSDLKVLLVGQSKNGDSPFNISDKSVKQELTGDWKAKVLTRIKSVDLVVVICGEYTANASGVNAEVKMAQEAGKPYFLLYGRATKQCKKPNSAKSSDKIYKWEWPVLKKLIGGAR